MPNIHANPIQSKLEQLTSTLTVQFLNTLTILSPNLSPKTPSQIQIPNGKKVRIEKPESKVIAQTSPKYLSKGQIHNEEVHFWLRQGPY